MLSPSILHRFSPQDFELYKNILIFGQDRSVTITARKHFLWVICINIWWNYRIQAMGFTQIYFGAWYDEMASSQVRSYVCLYSQCPKSFRPCSISLNQCQFFYNYQIQSRGQAPIARYFFLYIFFKVLCIYIHLHNIDYRFI